MKRATLIPLILIVISVLFGLFQIWPMYRDLGTLENDLVVTQQEFDNKGNYFSQLKNFKQELATHQEELAKIDEAIPVALALPSLYSHFETLSFSSGLVLLAIGSETEPFSGESDTAIQRTVVSIELLGSYEGLKEFLFQIDTSPKFINVDSIAFSVPDKADKGIAFSVKVNTFSY